MGDVRTTISLPEDLYAGVKSAYKDLGFPRMGDLVREAVRQYLHGRALQEKHRAMERAAADPEYRRLLREIGEDFRDLDAEGLPDY